MVDASVPDIALEPDKTVKKVSYIISNILNIYTAISRVNYGTTGNLWLNITTGGLIVILMWYHKLAHVALMLQKQVINK